MSLFLGTLVDSMCGRFVTAVVTKAFKEYVYMVNFLFICHIRFEWTEESIQHLGSCIRFFKEKVTVHSGRYQIFALLTQTWHALDQLCEAITHAGALYILHAGVYEPSHEWFKSCHANSSWRIRTAMDQVVFVQNVENPEMQVDFIVSRFQKSFLNGIPEETRGADSSILARFGAKEITILIESSNVWCKNEHPEADLYEQRINGNRNNI